MCKKLFVTGTDTDVGKTFCSCVITYALRSKGYTVRPYKPIVAGFENGENADLEAHLEACGLPLQALDLTACAYEDAIAPHIAAEKNNMFISYSELDEGLEKAEHSNCDFIITEGAGGWLLPIGGGRVLPQWEKIKNMGIVLVVGMKLGCLNHALLTAQAIRANGFNLVGFIAHSVTAELMPYYKENLETLKEMLDCDFLGDIPFVPSKEPNLVINCLNIELLEK